MSSLLARPELNLSPQAIEDRFNEWFEERCPIAARDGSLAIFKEFAWAGFAEGMTYQREIVVNQIDKIFAKIERNNGT